MTLFDGPRWFTIPAHRPFLEDLAAVLHRALAAPDPQAPNPEALADALVLTPTRRGARALADTFVKAAHGQAILLPQILAIGDLDEGEPPFEPGELALDLPPAVSPLQRRFELTRLVLDHGALFEGKLTTASALDLADALAAFLDALQIEEVDPAGKLESLVDDDLARHWLKSAGVLKIAVDAWPERLRALGLVDVNARRTALLRALAAQWTRSPPDRPLIAAGSTGTAPAAADLLRVIAAAPRGCVVLPGLDLHLAESAWAEVGEAHPQGAMKRLLDRAGLGRDAVAVWPAGGAGIADLKGEARRRLINEALRPPEATGDWLRIIEDLKAEGRTTGVDPVSEGLEGLSFVSARTEEAAATVCALLLREALETPGKTAALVTPDAGLARRVSARLGRWGVEADSSAGRPLAHYPAGMLMALLARTAAGQIEPATLLALIKHPLVRLGRSEAALERPRRLLERYGLRGPAPRSLGAVADLLTEARDRPVREGEAASPERAAALDAALALWTDFTGALAPLAAQFEAGAPTFAEAARSLAATMERLAADEAGDIGALWAGAGGEAAASLILELIAEGGGLGVDRWDVGELIEGLLSERLVRTGGANHPRLRILGALEARLVRADRLILAGLEEGVWPRVPPTDTFLSRPMRAKLGLPPPERRIGLSAHDFAQAASAPEAILVSTERLGGQPAVRSRWLWRLETLARGAGRSIPGRPDLETWAEALDAPLRPEPPNLKPAERPKPKPPLEARPRRLPVTRIETWVRDPYAVYAREILKLRPLDRPDAELAPWRRGVAIHTAFQRLAEAFTDGGGSSGAETLFADAMLKALIDAGFPEAALARERTLAARLGAWAAAFEAERRAADPELLIETEGGYAFEVQGRPFRVTAKADRIERVGDIAHVLDFKTGAAPTDKQVKAGFYPQLTLTAAILMRGGFEALGPLTPGELLYVRATGRRLAGERQSAVHKDHTALELAEAALEGLIRRVARFDDPETPYAPWTAPQFLGRRGGDYDHLSRLYEWRVMGEGEEGEE